MAAERWLLTTLTRLMLCLLVASPVHAQPVPMLQAHLPDGAVLAALPLPDGHEACLHWSHSVSGGPVVDCFANHGGQLLLSRSYLHDFAAGLGEIPGRGVLETAPEGGYWITGIDEVLAEDGLLLRIGRGRVDHRLIGAGETLYLSRMAPGALVRLKLTGP